MAHNWKIVLSGSGQTIGSPVHDLAVMKSIKLALNPILRATWFTRDLPFRWIGIMIRYDTEANYTPIFEPIEPSDGELPLIIYMKMSDVCDPA